MKGKNLLLGLNYIDRRFVEESEKETVSGKKVHNTTKGGSVVTMKKNMKRLLLVAAIITLMLFLMGCAWVVLHLNDLKMGEATYTQHPLYLEDGTKTPATEKTKEIISLQGVCESVNQRAAKEWYTFCQSYNQNRPAFNAGESFAVPDEYHSYGVSSQEMVDKVDEICGKYNLKLAGEGALLLEQAQGRMEKILGFDSILKKGAAAQSSYVGGRFYECGNFSLDYHVTGDGFREVYMGYSYADKDYFSSTYIAIDEPESVREWNYTTKDGTELLLVKDAEYGHIFCDRADAFLYIQLGGKLEEVPDLTKEEMEAVAETLNFDLKPGKVENMKALAAELDELYQTPISEDPAEVARRETEEKAHRQHDSFAELIADIRDNEAYFVSHCNIAYENFWDSMEYCLMDVNGDGEEDLLLGRDGNVTEIWTMRDGKTAALVGSWAQGYLCKGNVYEFAVVENGSHYHNYIDLITGKSLEQISYYPSDGRWNYQDCLNNTGWAEITEAQAFEIMDSYVRVELPDRKSVQEFPSL